jgi:hypothetical protein
MADERVFRSRRQPAPIGSVDLVDVLVQTQGQVGCGLIHGLNMQRMAALQSLITWMLIK